MRIDRSHFFLDRGAAFFCFPWLLGVLASSDPSLLSRTVLSFLGHDPFFSPRSTALPFFTAGTPLSDTHFPLQSSFERILPLVVLRCVFFRNDLASSFFLVIPVLLSPRQWFFSRCEPANYRLCFAPSLSSGRLLFSFFLFASYKAVLPTDGSFNNFPSDNFIDSSLPDAPFLFLPRQEQVFFFPPIKP